MGVSLLAASITIKSKYCWWNPTLINISTSCSHANIVSSLGACFQPLVWFMPQPTFPRCYLLSAGIAGHRSVGESSVCTSGRAQSWQKLSGCFGWVVLFAAYLQCCFSADSRAANNPTPCFLPSESCPGRSPSPLVALGSPTLVSVGTPSGRIIVGYT